MLQRQDVLNFNPLQSACSPSPLSPPRCSLWRSLALASGMVLAMGWAGVGPSYGQASHGQDRVGGAVSAAQDQRLNPPKLLAQGAMAEPPAESMARSEVAAPAAIVTALAQWDSAASQQDLNALLKGYSDRYRNSDGLDRRTLSSSLKRFWQQYPQLTYKTEVLSWSKGARGGTAEVLTSIEGQRMEGQRRLVLASVLRRRQVYEDGLLVSEEILSERSEVTTGDRPPSLQVNLPERVAPGQSFHLDVIVLEPVEKDLLLGGLVDEPVSVQGYGNPSQAELKPLIDGQTGTGPGGMFKIGEVPARGSDRWISAVVMRKDGITMVTQRLKVAKR
jgi:hypothetical protein